MSLDDAVADLAEPLRGRVPAGLPYSPWQLLEHLRITQHDILDFCRNPKYQEMAWPDDYWPKSPAPPSSGAWDASLRRFREDRAGSRARPGSRDRSRGAHPARHRADLPARDCSSSITPRTISAS